MKRLLKTSLLRSKQMVDGSVLIWPKIGEKRHIIQ